MQNPIKRPSYNELVELSNGDLIKRIEIAGDALTKARQEHQATTEKDLIYHVYDNERLKRLKLAKGNFIHLQTERSKSAPCDL